MAIRRLLNVGIECRTIHLRGLANPVKRAIIWDVRIAGQFDSKQAGGCGGRRLLEDAPRRLAQREWRMRAKLALLCAVALVSFHHAAQAGAKFLAGADFSFLPYFESLGVQYKDGGVVTDGIQILKNHGINCVRLRLFTSSAAQAAKDPYNYINNTNYTVPLAVRVKNAGLLFSLDFHYSDTWADAAHQAMPAAWKNLDFAQLVQQMQTYNSNTIATFAAAGAMPDYVQVGNEITGGMLWPYGGPLSGNGGTNWSQLGQLMKGAIQGIQDASTAAGEAMPKIIVHIDRGG